MRMLHCQAPLRGPRVSTHRGLGGEDRARWIALNVLPLVAVAAGLVYALAF
jgi:hypothetical protein